MEVAAGSSRGYVRARPRCEGTGPAGQLGQELAVARRASIDAPILPWTAAEDVAKISPVAASAAYLEHLRDAWNTRIAGKAAADRLENQEVFLTVPASFDAVARELTTGGRGAGRPEAGHVARGTPGRVSTPGSRRRATSGGRR